MSTEPAGGVASHGATALPVCSAVEPGLRLDCRNYRGDRPCAASVPGVCPSDCREYRPFGPRILVIKLGALGDVIRTLAILPALRDRWPDANVTWVSKPSGVRMLAHHPLIYRLLPFSAESIAHLELEPFDVCLSLDKEPAPAALAMRVRAAEKLGIGLSAFGTVFPLNAAARSYFALGLDDELKFRRNQKSYQQLVHEALGLPWRGQRYRLYPSATQRQRAARCWRGWGVAPGQSVIGLNTGAGDVFANKTWPTERFGHLARRLVGPYRVALLGGPREREQNRRIAAQVPGVIDTGCDHAELEFAALLERCNVVLTGDTMALHVAIALDVPVVALFGPTCAQEIDLYGRGTKLVTGVSCAPCYRRSCDKSPNCMDDLDEPRVLAALERWLAGPPRCALPVLEGVSASGEKLAPPSQESRQPTPG